MFRVPRSTTALTRSGNASIQLTPVYDNSQNFQQLILTLKTIDLAQHTIHQLATVSSTSHVLPRNTPTAYDEATHRRWKEGVREAKGRCATGRVRAEEFTKGCREKRGLSADQDGWDFVRNGEGSRDEGGKEGY